MSRKKQRRVSAAEQQRRQQQAAKSGNNKALIKAMTREEKWDYLRFLSDHASTNRGEYAGVPLPLEGNTLVISSTFKHAKMMQSISGAWLSNGAHYEPPPKRDPREGLLPGERLRSSFHMTNDVYQRSIYIVERADGKCYHLKHVHYRGVEHFDFLLNTLGCSVAWTIEAEMTAMEKLFTHISDVQRDYYVKTGMFLETSKRSRVTYLFRKSRPTIAFRLPHILAALCMHPIGFYMDSFAGVMTPSDDVLAHLLWMRSDERRYWGICNQHSHETPRSGL
jgi:hypothetical protein